MNKLVLPERDDDVPDFLRALFRHAVSSAMPSTCVPGHLPEPPKGRTLVVAIGKAAASMAASVEAHWPADAPLSGIALTRYGHSVACRRVEVIEAAHPVPDDRGHRAALRIMEDVGALSEDDLLLALVSGGGSALMTAPAEGVTLEEKKAINRALLSSGTPIGEMNVVRKHLSAVKGGRLTALAAPAQVVTLAISDVPFDDPSTIASGPTVPDSSTCADALEIIDRYGVPVSTGVRQALESGVLETPKPGDACFARARFTMVSRPADMIAAVQKQCEALGLAVDCLGADIEGEARTVGAEQAERAKQNPASADIILSGGETTVTVTSSETPGRGGRNCEYLLSLAIALDGTPGIHALAADTDGIDGSETNAGAIVAPATLSRGSQAGLDARAMLAAHDSFSFFERIGDLIETGPTRTNVNDFRVIWTGKRWGRD